MRNTSNTAIRSMLSVIKLRGCERNSESSVVNVSFIWQVGSAEIFREIKVHADKSSRDRSIQDCGNQWMKLGNHSRDIVLMFLEPKDKMTTVTSWRILVITYHNAKHKLENSHTNKTEKSRLENKMLMIAPERKARQVVECSLETRWCCLLQRGKRLQREHSLLLDAEMLPLHSR